MRRYTSNPISQHNGTLVMATPVEWICPFQANITEAHMKALSYISYIGGTLSITCCILSIAVYEFFR